MEPAGPARLTIAFAHAAHWHCTQVRKGPAPGEPAAPYMAQILGVRSLVMQAGGDEDEVITTLLHDVPEGHGGHGSRYGTLMARPWAGRHPASPGWW